MEQCLIDNKVCPIQGKNVKNVNWMIVKGQ